MKLKANTRTVVKHSYVRAGSTGKARAKAHVNYVAFRPGKDNEREARSFFNARKDGIKADEVRSKIERLEQKGVLIHKLILSPGEETVDMQEFTRALMKKMGKQKGTQLEYWAVIHDNTEHQHAHIIIAGRDKDGHRLRLSKKDYDFMRVKGDEISERIKVVEISPEKEVQEPSKLIQFFSRLGLPVKKLEPVSNSLTPTQRKEYELNLIGPAISSEHKLKQLEKEERRKKRNVEKQSSVISVYHTFVPNEYSCRSPKEELINLAREYDEGYLQDQITRRQRKMLGEWIDNWDKWQKDSEKLEKVARAKSHSIRRIEVSEGTEQEKTFSKESSLEDLKRVKRQNEDGDLVLNAAEEKALDRWIAEKRREEPVQIPLRNGRSMSCLPTDDLEFLEKAASASRHLLSEQEFKRLWFWIFQKRLTRDINKPIEVKSPLGKLVYSRSDELEQLKIIAEKYRTGEQWVTEQIAKDEYDRLCRWIKEKYEREPNIW